VHGFGEHAGRYEHVAQALSGAGWSVWAIDLRGHGISEGPRADIERLEWVLADLDLLVTQAGGKPVLLGHSMGGGIAAVYAALHPGRLHALVLSGPALQLASRPFAQVLAVRAIARVRPSAGVARIEPAQLSHDEEVVAAFARDPLVWHGRVPARTGFEMYRAARFAMGHAGELSLPVLMLHGEADEIVPVRASRQFFAEVGSKDKELRVFEGFYHESFQEIGKAEVIAGLVDWLSERRA
jgi:alpha-beta hydrolase superfamily lysophospholipase